LCRFFARHRIHRSDESVGPPSEKNEFVIDFFGWGRTIAANQMKTPGLLSTLIEACASKRRGLAISNEEQSDV
jgi:hypothetical protein